MATATARHAWPLACYFSQPHEPFAERVARAAAVGATHVNIGELPVKPRHEKVDPTDPYLEYAFILGCLFRYVVPEAVRSLTPADYEAKTRDALRRRCEVLRRHGLRGRLWLLEPFALPEAVYEAHPDWRGPRVDYPPRARRPYFAPCIDHPEVLALYRQAVRELLSELPEIDTFRLTTNDSGSGICWSTHLYSGTNGPAACKGRAYGERVRDFLQAFIDGGADAGVDVRVLLSPRGMSADQIALARQLQPPGGVVLPQPAGVPNSNAGAGAPRPILGISDPIRFQTQLVKAREAEEFSFSPINEADWRLLERFVEAPISSRSEQLQRLLEVAGELVGEAQAEDLLACWYDVQRALDCVEFLPWTGLLFEHGLLSKRWITRPFVAFPEELTAAERADWQPFLFEAGGDREVDNFLNLHASIPIAGRPQGREVRRICALARAALQSAIAGYCNLAAAVTDAVRPGLELTAARLQAFAHCFRTIGNAAAWQTQLDWARQRLADDPHLVYAVHDPWREQVWEICRDELDNTNAFATLLETAPGPLLLTASEPAEEDPFDLAPDLAVKLRRKAATMSRHWVDIARLFPWENHQPRSSAQ